MEQQGKLFEFERDVLKDESEYLPPTSPKVPEEDKQRLRGQNATILAMLREKPRTNAELVQVAAKYTSRISEVRAWVEARGGTLDNRKIGGGLTIYTLTEGRRCQTTSNSSAMPPTGSAASAAGS